MRAGDGRHSGQILTSDGVDDVVFLSFERSLCKELDEVGVAAMAADDDYLLTAVTAHLGGGLLQEFQLKVRAVGNGAGLVLGFEDLSKVVFRKHDGVFLLHRFEGRITDVQKIGSHGAGGPVLFDDSEGKQADTLGLIESFDEIFGRQFFPIGRESLGRGSYGQGGTQQKQLVSFHHLRRYYA